MIDDWLDDPDDTPEVMDAYSQLAVPHIPRYLKVLIAVGVFTGTVAIALGVWNLYGQQRLAAQRAADQTASQLASCESGNSVRKAITDYLATFPAGDPTEKKVQDFNLLKERLAPRDCRKAIVTDPGSSGTTTPTTKGTP